MEQIIGEKPHVVCMPLPAQGHISPMLELAKLLHQKGFYITFVHTEFNYKRLLKYGGLNFLTNLPNFRIETIPDGLTPPENPEALQNVFELCVSTSIHCFKPFRDVLGKLNNMSDVPRVSCILSDANMSFTLEVSEELGIPNVFFWTVNALTLMCYLHYSRLHVLASMLHKGETNDSKNGYLDLVIDWIPGIGNMHMRHMPSLIWSPLLPDSFVQYCIREISRTYRASATILNTFDALESDVLNPLRSMLNHKVYTIGPIHNLVKSVNPGHKIADTNSIKLKLWKEDSGCIEWLDSKHPGSVVYVNFGSSTIISAQQLAEFAWGLFNSNQNFLWIVRQDLVKGEKSDFLPEFERGMEGRGFLGSWCDQDQVLNHPSVGMFLTHCGWNSTLESLSAGVPMICWPFFADQQTVCYCICKLWGVGVEIDSDARKEVVEEVVKELMEGEKGREMKERAVKWKKEAENAISCGSSYQNLDMMINEVILSQKLDSKALH